MPRKCLSQSKRYKIGPADIFHFCHLSVHGRLLSPFCRLLLLASTRRHSWKTSHLKSSARLHVAQVKVPIPTHLFCSTCDLKQSLTTQTPQNYMPPELADLTDDERVGLRRRVRPQDSSDDESDCESNDTSEDDRYHFEPKASETDVQIFQEG